MVMPMFRLHCTRNCARNRRHTSSRCVPCFALISTKERKENSTKKKKYWVCGIWIARQSRVNALQAAKYTSVAEETLGASLYVRVIYCYRCNRPMFYCLSNSAKIMEVKDRPPARQGKQRTTGACKWTGCLFQSCLNSLQCATYNGDERCRQSLRRQLILPRQYV